MPFPRGVLLLSLRAMQIVQPTAMAALAGTLLWFLAFPGAAPVHAASLGVTTAGEPTRWTVSYQGKPVLVYRADPRQFKPYVEQLATVNGYGILRNTAADHLHHHALMYGITVNGLNFWEEASGSGVQKVVATTGPETFTTANLPGARLTQLIYWVAPEDAFLPNTNTAPLLIERRTLRLVVNPQDRATALHWQSTFQVGTKTNSVTLTGTTYHGLGLRFLKELDPVAVHLNSAGFVNLPDKRQDVSSHPWAAVQFLSPENPATLAIFGSPANRGGDPVFFAMNTPFAYLSATQGLDKQPLTYKTGDTFTLDYLVTLHPEVQSADALENVGRQWNKALGGR